MQISDYALSKTFFDLFHGMDHKLFCDGNSLRKRFSLIKILLESLLYIPLGIGYKIYKTFFRLLGLFWSASLVILTFGSSNASRSYFFQRLASFSKDFGDWVLYPFAISLYFIRFLFGSLISPNLFFRF